VAGNGSYVGKPVPRKDNNGQKLSSAARQKAMTLRKYNNRARWTNRDVRIANAFRALEVPLQQLELPHIVLRRAGEILQRSIDSWDMKNIHPVAVASFLWAVRQYDIPVSEQEILDVYPHASFAVPTLNKAKFHLQEALGDIFPLLSAAQFVPRYLSELRKLQDVRERARINDVDLERYFCEIEKRTYSVLRQVKGHSDFQGRCPPALAASAIYAMLRIDEPPKLLTQKNLEEATAVTSYSVRCHWVRLWKPILERSGLLKQNNNGGEKTV
jgi:transcription initiation factor TFIIIB Brf1 subunit/transcription initiation factor TFIIB